jgi:hypothetical protein
VIIPASIAGPSCFILRSKFTPKVADWELSLATGVGALAARDYGINPHSNILLAIGGATLLINTARICGSVFRNAMAFCSCGEGGCGGACFFCHNCSQGVLVYFCTTLAATLSRIGYCS